MGKLMKTTPPKKNLEPISGKVIMRVTQKQKLWINLWGKINGGSKIKNFGPIFDKVNDGDESCPSMK